MKTKKKYTYDEYHFQSNGCGYSAGIGSNMLQAQRKLFVHFINHYPEDIILIIRRPDNKLMNFYHPFMKII